ncbi:sulfatase [Bacteroidia bacterium]|nr:sulfatase [Bacteroidia bacterium]
MKTSILISAAAVSAAGIGALQARQQPPSQAQKPNVIIFMVDQQRADLLAREGYPLQTMPFADSLARCGAWFNRAYTSAPASVPARTSMVTGRFPKATRVRSNHNAEDAFFVKDLFDIARESGYRTALVGKNHTYIKKEKTDYWDPYNHGGQNSPRKDSVARAFDRYLASTHMYANLQPSPGDARSQLPYRMVDDASRWIGSLDGAPFLMWFSVPEPHNPYQTCEPYYSMFPPESLPRLHSSAADRAIKGERYQLLSEMMAMGHVGYAENLQRLRSIYHGMLRMIDDQFRRMVGELRRQGVYDNTIILYLSDHGDYVGEYGLMKKGVGLDEVLVRIPMQWSGPGIVASATPQRAHVSIVDIFPTFCEIAGAEIPAGVQGRSLWPMLRGESYPEGEFSSIMAEAGYGGMYYTRADGSDFRAEGAVGDNDYFDELNSWSQSGTMRMVREGDWKLTSDMDGNNRLYNLKSDPSELHDLYNAKAHAAVRERLTALLLRWELSTEDALPLPRNRYRFKTNPHNYLFRQ